MRNLYIYTSVSSRVMIVHEKYSFCLQFQVYKSTNLVSLSGEQLKFKKET